MKEQMGDRDTKMQNNRSSINSSSNHSKYMFASTEVINCYGSGGLKQTYALTVQVVKRSAKVLGGQHWFFLEAPKARAFL